MHLKAADGMASSVGSDHTAYSDVGVQLSLRLSVPVMRFLW